MITIDYRDKRPIYEQVVDKLEHLIIGGALEADSKMPSVRTLAVELSVNPNTIQRAYTILEQTGYLYTITGRGNFVAPEGEWRDNKTQTVLKDCREMIQQAKEFGITKAQIMDELGRIYEEVQNDRSEGNQ